MKIKGLILTAFVVLFTAIIYYRDFAVVDFSKMYLVVFAFATAAVLDYKHIIYMLCFLFPLSCGIPGNYIYPLLILLLLIKDKEFSFKKLVFFAVILLMELLHYGFYTFEIQLAEVIGYASFLFMLSYIVADESKEVDQAKCVTYFCIGACVLILAIIINTNLLMSQMTYVDEGIRLGDSKELGDFQVERMMLSANANTIGYYSISAIACLLVLQYYRKIKSVLFITLLAVVFYGGVLSVSRTWALLIVFSFFAYMFMQQKDRIKGFLLVGILIAGALVFIVQNPLIFDSFVGRFTQDASNLATAGNRTVLFQAYNQFLAENPIALCFGTGAVYYGEVTRVSESVHNALQQILVSYGVLGLGIFIFAFCKSVNKYFNKKNLMALLPLCVTVLFVQSIQILNPYFLMCPIVVAFSALKMGSEQYKISSK